MASPIIINQQTNRIYVGGLSNITVLDGNSNTIIGSIPKLGTSFSINPLTNLIYFASPAVFLGEYDNVTVYSGATLQLVKTINIPGSEKSTLSHVGSVAVNPNTNMVYATFQTVGRSAFSETFGTIYKIDANNDHAVVKSASYDTEANELIINPYTNYVYAGSSILDGGNLSKLEQKYAGDLNDIDPIHNLIYTIDKQYTYTFDTASTKSSLKSQTIYVLDGETHKTVSSFKLDLDFESIALALNPNTSKLYLTTVMSNLTEAPTTGEIIIASSQQPIHEFTLNTFVGVTVVVALGTITATAVILKKRTTPD
jgi:hypothetical protein